MSIYQVFRNKNEGSRVHRSTQPDKSHPLYLVYASQFIEYQSAIKLAKKTFSQEQVWPDQCDYILFKIGKLQKTANSIASFANSKKKDGSGKPGNNYYPLLVSAHYLYDQTELLSSFIREYKETAENRSAKKSKQRLVVGSLHHLESSLDDLISEIDKTMKPS